jgi:hypothetical protein
MGCDAGGSFKTLLRIMESGGFRKSEPADDVPDNVIPITGKRLPSRKQLKLWHTALLRNRPALRKMTEGRGLTPETLAKHLIGYDGQRFTIPIFDENGELVNVRRYKPNAKRAQDKMMSYAAGHGTARLYGIDTLAKHDKVLLTEGEMDRLIALQYGLPAATDTGGASVFKAEWAPHFKGKIVYVAYDEDTAGDAGARKVAQILKHSAEAVYRVELGTGIKGGDVTDFFMQGRTGDDLWAAMKVAKPLFVSQDRHEVPDKGKPVSIVESQNPRYKEPLELTVMVSGKVEPPYAAPQRLVGTCDQAAGVKCNLCPFAVSDGKRTVDLHPDDPRLLQFIDSGQKRKHELYVELSEAACKTHVQFEVDDEFSIEEIAVSPSVEHRTEEVDTPITRIVYNVGTYRTPVNQLARIVGNQTSDPRTGRYTFHGWNLEPVLADLDTFKMTPALKTRLATTFRPAEGQSPLAKCVEVAEDLAANVTHIYGRPWLHVGYDLVWHSLTSFMFEGSQIPKGWLECLVLGDTRTGKSEAAGALAAHYGSGIIKSLEGASFAGLVGGAQQQSGKHWMITWGLLPLNDRRLVVLDEMSGLFGQGKESKGIIEAMSSIRSEGKAQITKITTEETSARTRLIWISNPLHSTALSEASGGSLPALQELVRNPEDIARFDYVMAATGKDVPSAVINSTRHRKVPHRATASLSHELVMWAWSRRADQVKFLKGVEEYIYAAAEDLGSRYVPDPPLVQIANVRVKVARLAVALAARTFSTDKTGEVVVVKRAHVKSAVAFLDRIYGEEAMGYRARSAQVMENRRRAEKAKEDARKYLKNNLQLVEVLMAVGATDFRKRDFEEFGGVDRDDVGVIVAKLLGWRLIQRKSRGYMAMEPALVELLRELEAEGG